MADFPVGVRALILARDASACVLCWKPSRQIHHRRARGMGGTKRPGTSMPANGVVLCGSGTTGCHHLVESDREWALECGLLVPQAKTPSTIPVMFRSGWWFLTDDGGKVKTHDPRGG